MSTLRKKLAGWAATARGRYPSVDDDLPRSHRNLPDLPDPSRPYRYRVPQGVKATSVHPDDGFRAGEVETATARVVGHREVVIVSADVTPALEQAVGYILGPADHQARRGIAARLREDGCVVSADDHVKEHHTVTVEATWRVVAWPDIPGVTTPPWRPVHEDIPVPRTPEEFDAAREIRDRSLRDGMWEFVWLAHPATALSTGHSSAIYGWVADLARVIPDNRVPPGVLRPCERVSRS